MTEPTITRTETSERFIVRRFEEAQDLVLFKMEPSTIWGFILAAILLVALVYVVLMYIKDSRSIGIAWAILLGTLRLGCYALLAWAFLEPAIEHTKTQYTETVTNSQMIVVFDGSLSMSKTKDDLPSPGHPVAGLPTRQEKIFQFLKRAGADDKTPPNVVGFLDTLRKADPDKPTKQNTVYVYRFGGTLDPAYLVLANDRQWVRPEWEDDDVNKKDPALGKRWSDDQWRLWLNPDAHSKALEDDEKDKPDQKKFKGWMREVLTREKTTFDSTNVPASMVQVLEQSRGKRFPLLQGIVVFSDGKSTTKSYEALNSMARLARERNVPIYVVKVGDVRKKVELDLADLRGPEIVRPDDTFYLTAEVRGKGMGTEKATVELDVFRPDAQNPDKYEDRPVKTIKAEVSFGENEAGEARFEIDPKEFGEDVTETVAPSGKPGEKPETTRTVKNLRKGDWKFVARVPRHPLEIFEEPFHTHEPVVVHVQKEPLRVLLFAGSPTRDYQFVRTLFVREKDRGRVDLTIYIQPVPPKTEPEKLVIQDVDEKHFLKHFPDNFRDLSQEADEDAKLNNLAAYDVMIAFDPDWTRLTPEQRANVNKWVNVGGGGLIAIGGPINTIQLARDAVIREESGRQLTAISDLYPVLVQDNRIQDLERPTNEAWRLNFVPENFSKDMDFLNLEDAKEGTAQTEALLGWDEFFTGRKLVPGEHADTVRGFYNFYPVKPKLAARVVATFADPRAKMENGKDMPYLVVNEKLGHGRCVWIGSGESWRLRQYKESFHERFWTKLARYAGSGRMGKEQHHLVPNFGKHHRANELVKFEIQLRDVNLDPLGQNARPVLRIWRERKDGKLRDIRKDAPDKVEYLHAKPKGEREKWNGWFVAEFFTGEVTGDEDVEKFIYEFSVEEKGLIDKVLGRYDVRRTNPETEDTAPDPEALYRLASEATPVLNKLGKNKAAVREVLRKGSPVPAKPGEEDPELHLYFDLSNADTILKTLDSEESHKEIKLPPEYRIEDCPKDLFDYELFGTHVSPLMLMGIGLFCVEWLTRKLLRLA